MVKWAIHMFINRIKMTGWLLPSTLGGKFTQALFTISNQRDLAHGLRINSIKVGFCGKEFQVNQHSKKKYTTRALCRGRRLLVLQELTVTVSN